MKKYIDKSVLAAEIERQRKIYMYDVDNRHSFGRMMECNDLLVFIDTLEVKEVCDIWHDVSEKPELEQPLLIVMNGTYKHFSKRYRIGCYGKRANDIPTWVIDGCYFDSFISKWCYISDILQHTLEIKEVENTELLKVKGYLVRDKDDYTALYAEKPHRGKTEWVNDSCLMTINDARLAPDIEFEDEPVEVEVTLKRV